MSKHGDIIGAHITHIDDALRHIIEIARSSAQDGNYGVGVLIGRWQEGKDHFEVDIIGTNRVNNPVSVPGMGILPARTDTHAEIDAGRQLEERRRQNGHDESPYLMLGNLEPCIMCQGFLRRAQDYVNLQMIYISNDSVVPGTAMYQPHIRHRMEKVIRRHNPAEELFHGQIPDPALLAQAGTIFSDSAELIRAEKKRRLGTNGGEFEGVHEILARKDGHTSRLERHIDTIAPREFLQHNLFGQRFEDFDPSNPGNVPDRIVQMLLTLAKATHDSGHAGLTNAAVVLDGYGNVLFGAGDKTAKDLFKTPVFRVAKRFDEAYQLGDMAEHLLPKLKDCTIICLKEPDEFEAGRISTLMGRKIVYMIPDLEHGIVSSGALSYMASQPEVNQFYLQSRNLGIAFVQADLGTITNLAQEITRISRRKG